MLHDVIVIGAGVAGISAALRLAENGHTVILIEKATLGSGASGKNPGRMGHGFHYVDAETAKMYLQESIKVQRKYPNYLRGQDRDFNDPIRHGRYFITKTSDNKPDEILATYEKIKEEYIRLINLDPKNEVFGPPDRFFRILEPHEYQDRVNAEIIDVGVETAEHLFEWEKFSLDIKRKISTHPKITLLENTEVIHLEKGQLELGERRFTLHTMSKELKQQVFKTDYLVNSTWEQIEKLNDQLGIRMIPNSRTNRLKCLLKVKLPTSLINAHSMFFCMGQYCMFSNLGNGFGFLTYAPITNMAASSDLALNKELSAYVQGDIAEELKTRLAQDILAGVSHFIPEMQHAQPVAIHFGIVQTAGSLSLHDLTNPKHSYHKRDYDGIREELVGHISNPCMKLFYFERNGEVVNELIHAATIATILITYCFHQIGKSSKLSLNNDLKKTIHEYLDRYLVEPTVVSDFISSNSDDEQIVSECSRYAESIKHTLFKTITNKKIMIDEFQSSSTHQSLKTERPKP